MVWNEEYQQESKNKKETKKEFSELMRMTDADIYEAMQGSVQEDGSVDQDQFYQHLYEIKMKKKKLYEDILLKSPSSWFVKVNFFGKTEKQPGDFLYYVCIDQLDIKGSLFCW